MLPLKDSYERYDKIKDYDNIRIKVVIDNIFIRLAEKESDGKVVEHSTRWTTIQPSLGGAGSMSQEQSSFVILGERFVELHYTLHIEDTRRKLNTRE